MIVIVEGIDRTGKTTLCKKLERLGFYYFKDDWNINTKLLTSSEIPSFSIGKLDTTLSLIRSLIDKYPNIVIDRLHLTEYAYGISKERGLDIDAWTEVDTWLKKFYNTLIVYMDSEDLAKSSSEAGEDLTEIHRTFSEALMRSKLDYLYSSYSKINETIRHIINKSCKYHIYFASPFFNPEQIEREEALKQILRNQGLRVFSPKEYSKLSCTASKEERQLVFNQNLESINNSFALFAITDGKDMGTIWEAGYAYAKNKPIIYFAETLGKNQEFNLMLAQSGRLVYRSRLIIQHADIINDLIYNFDLPYEGLIE